MAGGSVIQYGMWVPDASQLVTWSTNHSLKSCDKLTILFNSTEATTIAFKTFIIVSDGITAYAATLPSCVWRRVSVHVLYAHSPKPYCNYSVVDRVGREDGRAEITCWRDKTLLCARVLTAWRDVLVTSWTCDELTGILSSHSVEAGCKLHFLRIYVWLTRRTLRLVPFITRGFPKSK